jgi:anthranilate/para-aminobenzoate synthase component II
LLGEQAPSTWMYTSGVSSQLRTTNEGHTLTYFSHTQNLQNLIEYLALSAICIGPGPGMQEMMWTER